jgi:hypothetical protein
MPNAVFGTKLGNMPTLSPTVRIGCTWTVGCNGCSQQCCVPIRNFGRNVGKTERRFCNHAALGTTAAFEAPSTPVRTWSTIKILRLSNAHNANHVETMSLFGQDHTYSWVEGRFTTYLRIPMEPRPSAYLSQHTVAAVAAAPAEPVSPPLYPVPQPQR